MGTLRRRRGGLSPLTWKLSKHLTWFGLSGLGMGLPPQRRRTFPALRLLAVPTGSVEYRASTAVGSALVWDSYMRLPNWQPFRLRSIASVPKLIWVSPPLAVRLRWVAAVCAQNSTWWSVFRYWEFAVV